MALKLQYNKTQIQRFNKQLVIREKALPTLKSKETALRVEVKKTANELEQLEDQLKVQLQKEEKSLGLWTEMPDVIQLKAADIKLKNIAGVKIPLLKDIEYTETKISYFNQPAWIPNGLNTIKSLIRLKLEIEIKKQQFDILNYARKKTTQKVNLYEKVQIPEFKASILKIKRFLEDAENLSKAAQKIVKQRNAEREAAL